MIALVALAAAAPAAHEDPWAEGLRTGEIALMDVATAAELDAAYDPLALSGALALEAWKAAGGGDDLGRLLGGSSASPRPDPGPRPEPRGAVVVELSLEAPGSWYGHIGARALVPCCEEGSLATVRVNGAALVITVADGLWCDQGATHPAVVRLTPAVDGTVRTVLCGEAVRLLPGPSRRERLDAWEVTRADALLQAATAELPALARTGSAPGAGWNLPGIPLERCRITTIDCDPARLLTLCDRGEDAVAIGRFTAGWDVRPTTGPAMCADHPLGGIADRN